VKPRLNPVLSEYLERLTGITNARMAEEGVDLVGAFAKFLEFIGGAPTWAFGHDDLIFVDNFRLYGLSPPMPAYENIAPWLRANGVHPKHAGDTAEAAGTALSGQKHDALFDARSVAAGVRALVARGAPNPFLIDFRRV